MAATSVLNTPTHMQAQVAASSNTNTRSFITRKTVVRTEQLSPFTIFSLTSLFVLSLLVYFHTVLVENQANQKQQQIITIKADNDVLQAVLAEKKSLAVVEQKAIGMGMMPVEQYHYITLDSSTYHDAENKHYQPVIQTHTPPRTPVGF
ncbi:MAG: hypothetical protein IV090_14660 [Candidatus Sericytochromatia bacterium]|nr:hypothetical protein [Candidatus Sericytochromatia bacterium]